MSDIFDAFKNYMYLFASTIFMQILYINIICDNLSFRITSML